MHAHDGVLLAMAPVAVQCTWSMRASIARREGYEPWRADDVSSQQREAMLQGNRDTCHVWADNGEHMAAVRAGEPIEVMLTLQRRWRERGLANDGSPMPP